MTTSRQTTGEAVAAQRLSDSFGRVIKDLRISVTPRCNLRCDYCNPLGSEQCEPPGGLSVRDVANLIDAAVSLGLGAVRFTGGEPLLRRDLPDMIRHAKRVAKVPDVAITTNGTLLARRLPELIDAGLDRVNVSLDALDPQVFRSVTGGSIVPVLAGIEAAFEAGLTPLKINAVVIRGTNEEEVVGLAGLTRERPLEVRFIEYMHLNHAPAGEYHDQFVAGAETRARIERAHGALAPVPTDPSAPARRFRVPGWSGTLGFINAVSEPFCEGCSRMRMTSDARLRPCLMHDWELDARSALDDAEPVEALRRALRTAAWNKVFSGMREGTRDRTMVAIGG